MKRVGVLSSKTNEIRWLSLPTDVSISRAVLPSLGSGKVGG